MWAMEVVRWGRSKLRCLMVRKSPRFFNSNRCRDVISWRILCNCRALGCIEEIIFVDEAVSRDKKISSWWAITPIYIGFFIVAEEYAFLWVWVEFRPRGFWNVCKGRRAKNSEVDDRGFLTREQFVRCPVGVAFCRSKIEDVTSSFDCLSLEMEMEWTKC